MKLVLGLGETGLSVARFLTKQNIDYKIADSRLRPPLLDNYITDFPNSPAVLGEWTQELLTDIDEVFISPGIEQTQSIVIWARDKNIPVVSDIELFSRFAKAPIIGITGSNGKSTVTQLLGDMVANSNKAVAVGGNIGKPALDCLDDRIDYYVLELSSYQLDYTNQLKLLTGVVLNITPDHLDRYDDFDDYVDSKLSLYQYCQNLVVNLDETLVPNKNNAIHFGIDIPKQADDFGTVTCHGSCYLIKGDDVVMSVSEMQLIGEHNVANMLAALALGDQIGLDVESMAQSVKDFKGLEHRLEWVAKKQGIDYYNDSKATNAISTIKALNALIDKHENIVLIAGGIAKEEDYSAMFELIDENIASVILIGQSAVDFGQNLNKSQVSYVQTMSEAVNLASGMLNDGVVLLSPACASFDMFANFEERGQVFKDHVFKLP
ncbi:UDP-N-acetylmuramoyl-L-alanine--D-glutamate ligase [Candidatus Thioglobus sp.]|jgi:UDP-N-acetylmuramoylalanine--D-glutamate ligase (EC 6.3.2.9)|uniref:UDP-N-acetylmuramoyl-L-alanine--D-glutamate ligase n=1 Tax=Candidatus Thioglobus sp. TaxID=2026721 RepID=UPI001757AC47|nr:UDP-N-acetylmuramoyl-L-alanine--D-glutamate ligase [Candidatus Thioglobus sp.]